MRSCVIGISLERERTTSATFETTTPSGLRAPTGFETFTRSFIVGSTQIMGIDPSCSSRNKESRWTFGGRSSFGI